MPTAAKPPNYVHVLTSLFSKYTVHEWNVKHVFSPFCIYRILHCMSIILYFANRNIALSHGQIALNRPPICLIVSIRCESIPKKFCQYGHFLKPIHNSAPSSHWVHLPVKVNGLFNLLHYQNSTSDDFWT